MNLNPFSIFARAIDLAFAVDRIDAVEAKIGRLDDRLKNTMQCVAALEPEKKTLYCSFCSKSQHALKQLIAGPTAFICDECVELCVKIIDQHARPARPVDNGDSGGNS